jgi:hypothetical protein
MRASQPTVTAQQQLEGATSASMWYLNRPLVLGRALVRRGG